MPYLVNARCEVEWDAGWLSGIIKDGDTVGNRYYIYIIIVYIFTDIRLYPACLTMHD